MGLSGPLIELHQNLRSQFIEALTQTLECPQPVQWANGFATQAEKDLAPVLIQHGVPPEHAVSRAKAAVRSTGAQPVLDALGSRIPWKQLKTLGNQVKFQFLLPAELQSKVESAAGQGSIGRPKVAKRARKSHRKRLHQPWTHPNLPSLMVSFKLSPNL